MSNFDYYAAARNLITLLYTEGHAIEAEELKDAMENGATGTEILMALRFHLAKIIRSVSLKGALQIHALKLLSELDKSLE
jgi:hypothetical protein